MESRIIKLTSAAEKYGNLNIGLCGEDFFPSDVFGESSRKAGLGVPITLEVDGLPKLIQTDIPKYANGKPHWIFRNRKWVKHFVRYHKLNPSDLVVIERLDKRKYKITPNNHKSKVTQKRHSKSEGEIFSLSKNKLESKKRFLDIGCNRICDCPKTHINCLPAKEWLKCQLGVWQFTYESRDVRDKTIHPATFPIALARKLIELFTHQGELVLDPFVGSGTTLTAAKDLNRNSVGFDLQAPYC